MDLELIQDFLGKITSGIRKDGDGEFPLMGGLVLPEHVIGLDIGDRSKVLETEKEIGRNVRVDMEPESGARSGNNGRFPGRLDQSPDRVHVDFVPPEQGFSAVSPGYRTPFGGYFIG